MGKKINKRDSLKRTSLWPFSGKMRSEKLVFKWGVKYMAWGGAPSQFYQSSRNTYSGLDNKSDFGVS